MKFKTKIFLIVTACGLLPLIVSFTFYLFSTWESQKKLILRVAQKIVNSGAYSLSLYFQERKTEIATYANMPLIKTMDWKKIRPFLKNEVKRHNGIYEKMLLGMPGPEAYFYNTTVGNPYYGGLCSFDDSDPKAKLRSIAERDYWQYTAGKNPDAEPRVYVSNPMVSYTTGVRQIMVAATILSNDNKKVLGIISGSIEWKELERILLKIEESVKKEFGKDSHFFLISQDGTYVYHWDKEKAIHLKTDKDGKFILNKIGEKISVSRKIFDEDKQLAEAGKLMLRKNTGHILYKLPGTEKKDYLFFASITPANYALCLFVPEKVIIAPLREGMYFYGLLGLTAFFVTTLLCILLSNIALKPINMLTKKVLKLSEGNWDVRLDDSSEDAIGTLASTFNTMVIQLRDRDFEIRGHREHLQDMVNKQMEELRNKNLLLQEKMEAYSRLSNNMKSILDTIDSPIRIIDQDYNITYANKKYNEMTGEKNAVGKKCYETLPGKDCHTEHCRIRRIMAGEEKIDVDVEKRMPDGSTRNFMLIAQQYHTNEGKNPKVLEIFYDITERNKIQKLTERNAEQKGKIEMSNNILHDIGNTLTGLSAFSLRLSSEKEWPEIKSFGQLEELLTSKEKELFPVLGETKTKALLSYINIFKKSLNERNEQYMEIIDNITKSISHISSVLELQRQYSKENITLLSKSVKIQSIVKDSLFLVSESLKKRGIEIQMDFQKDIPEISGDKTRLMQVILNILKNACESFDYLEEKYTETKILKISISLDDKGLVQISFCDNGIGFEPILAEKCMERGFSTKRTGSGIGLHECMLIIKSHGGDISIKSKGVNKGAEVIITLPIEGVQKREG